MGNDQDLLVKLEPRIHHAIGLFAESSIISIYVFNIKMNTIPSDSKDLLLFTSYASTQQSAPR
jgi:hypothetical protein